MMALSMIALAAHAHLRNGADELVSVSADGRVAHMTETKKLQVGGDGTPFDEKVAEYSGGICAPWWKCPHVLHPIEARGFGPSAFELVTVRCKEDVAKSELLQRMAEMDTFSQVTVYEKCGQSLSNKSNISDKFMEGVGWEEAGYLSYISERYDTLPDWVAFVHGIPEDHRKGLAQILNDFLKTTTGNEVYIPLGLPFVEKRSLAPNGGAAVCSLASKKDPTAVDRCLDSMTGAFDRDQILALGSSGDFKAFSFHCCGEFIASRNAIRRNPRSFYEGLLDFMMEKRLGNTEAVACVTEQLWHMFFGQPLQERRLGRKSVAGFFKNTDFVDT